MHMMLEPDSSVVQSKGRCKNVSSLNDAQSDSLSIMKLGETSLEIRPPSTWSN